MGTIDTKYSALAAGAAPALVSNYSTDLTSAFVTGLVAAFKSAVESGQSSLNETLSDVPVSFVNDTLLNNITDVETKYKPWTNNVEEFLFNVRDR